MKSNKINRYLALTLVFVSITACASSSNPQTQKQDLTNFQNISFNISGNLYLTQGDSYSVKLEGNESDLAEIITKVEGNTLIIKTKSDWKNVNDVKVYVTLPELEGLDLAGSGNVYAYKEIKTSSIEISLSGSGNISFENLLAENTEASLAGSGNITVKGKSSETISISIAGSGNVYAEGIETKNGTVDISGSGSVKIYATENLTTNLVGSGSVFYKGKPLVNANSVGSGSTKSM